MFVFVLGKCLLMYYNTTLQLLISGLGLVALLIARIKYK